MATKKDAAKAATPAKKAPVKPAAKSAAPKKPEPKAPAKAVKPAKVDAKPAKAVKPVKGDVKSPARVATGKARVYQPHDTFEVGETIRHPGWNEEGIITELTETPDGLSFIVVDFGSRGCKRLVVDYSLKI